MAPLLFPRPILGSLQAVPQLVLKPSIAGLLILVLFPYIYYSCNYIYRAVFVGCWYHRGWVLYAPAALVVSSAPVACFYEPAPRCVDHFSAASATASPVDVSVLSGLLAQRGAASARLWVWSRLGIWLAGVGPLPLLALPVRPVCLPTLFWVLGFSFEV